eukprot:TRINITY_DN74313_c0_g1_i1.p1 TRINITY_DN74313_c0_g1~~TRINITY_DN74313_c0_g1_i1.p1  ORF type:complete len:719 (-),score=160.27 TRINITY_DN74313_c0_g1_i1:280-2436(-)
MTLQAWLTNPLPVAFAFQQASPSAPQPLPTRAPRAGGLVPRAVGANPVTDAPCDDISGGAMSSFASPGRPALTATKVVDTEAWRGEAGAGSYLAVGLSFYMLHAGRRNRKSARGVACRAKPLVDQVAEMAPDLGKPAKPHPAGGARIANAAPGMKPVMRRPASSTALIEQAKMTWPRKGRFADRGKPVPGRKQAIGKIFKVFGKKEGIIMYGVKQKQIKFAMSDVDPEGLEARDGFVAEGASVEFEIEVPEWPKRPYAVAVKFPPNKTFGELGLTDEVVKGACAALGLKPEEDPSCVGLLAPAPVQAEAIPKLLQGEDLCIAAETGSGKTLAYMLPMVQHVKELANERNLDYGLAFRAASPLAVLLCPTRELAAQACHLLKLMCRHVKLRVRLVHGGSGTYTKQRKEISQVVDVLVATPDRLLKFYKDKDIKFEDVAHIVIDEADFLLTQGFADCREIIREISEKSRRKANLRKTLATASLTKPFWKVIQDDKEFRGLRVLESRSLHRPQANCTHGMILTKGRDKFEMLISMLRFELDGTSDSKQTIVFCNTRKCCESVVYKLREAFCTNRVNRFIGTLNKEMPSHEREDTLRQFARGEYKVLICTDIAQRGLDLPTCGHVINFDFPLNSIDYLHRAGRTARFGEPGKVTSLVKKGDKYLAKAIERNCQLGKPINDLSGDKRDYMRGGALHHLLARQPHASAADRRLAPPKQYDGSLR